MQLIANVSIFIRVSNDPYLLIEGIHSIVLLELYQYNHQYVHKLSFESPAKALIGYDGRASGVSLVTEG